MAGGATPAVSFASGTPFWLYLLAEAEVVGRETTPGVFQPGEGLGPAAARVVAETIIGLLELDPRAFLGSNRRWSPAVTADALGGGVCTLQGLLTF